MRNSIWIVSLLLICAIDKSAGAHVNDALLPEGCGSCHVGHGMSDQPMLARSEEEFCFQCHGSDQKRSAMVSGGRLSSAARLQDMEPVFKKQYHHPVEVGSGHSPVEKLPAFKGSVVSHAECVDCHNPHQKIQIAKGELYDVPGYSLSGQYVEKNSREYEICLKCHAEFVGFDRSARDLTKEFAITVRSQHPVTRSSSGNSIPSLSTSVPRGSIMRCSSCHTNDDPEGPRGPHGSSHEYLLSGNYTLDVYSEESPYAYEFCYSCHDRTSILSNESFPMHRQHIEGDLINDKPGTSCFTCHASHGSADNEDLIEFNPRAVTPDSGTGIVRYVKNGDSSGECYLTCHGHAHSPGKFSSEMR